MGLEQSNKPLPSDTTRVVRDMSRLDLVDEVWPVFKELLKLRGITDQEWRDIITAIVKDVTAGTDAEGDGGDLWHRFYEVWSDLLATLKANPEKLKENYIEEYKMRVTKQQLEQIIREELRINEIEDFTRPRPGERGHPRTQEEYDIQAVKGAVLAAAAEQEQQSPQELNKGMEDAIKSRIDRAWKFVGKLEVPADVEDEVNLLRQARDILSDRDDNLSQDQRVSNAVRAPEQKPSWLQRTPEDAGPAWALARLYLMLSKTSEEV